MSSDEDSCKEEKKNVDIDPQLSSPLLNNKRIDRQWLVTLLQTHQSKLGTVKQQERRDELHAKYPVLRNKALAVAPMVEQSDLPFRLLCRKYGANLAYTPMIHARYFVNKHSYRQKMWSFTNNGASGGDSSIGIDRPLIAQLCGSNKDILLQAAKLLEDHVDAIDLNCGCPTLTAKRGRYGAYLLQSGNYLVDIVRHLAENLSCPLSVKVRLLPGGLEDSLALYGQLIDAGAALLTVHGRTRLHKGAETGKADWNAIREVVDCFGDRVPIIANGNISNLDDVRNCLALTGVDGVMSSESILEYPPLFTETQTAAVEYKRTGPGRLQIAREYLDLCKDYPPDSGGGGTGMQCIRMHIDTFLHEDWKIHPELRESLRIATDLDCVYGIINSLELSHKDRDHEVENEKLSWYMRHRPTN